MPALDPLPGDGRIAELPDDVAGSIVLGAIACTMLAALGWAVVRLVRSSFAPAAQP